MGWRDVIFFADWVFRCACIMEERNSGVSLCEGGCSYFLGCSGRGVDVVSCALLPVFMQDWGEGKGVTLVISQITSCLLATFLSCPTDVPKLQPHPGLEKKEEDDDEDEYDDGSSVKKQANKNRVQSGPRTPNPYASDNSSLMFPILVAFGVFIPTLFCLCRL